MKQKHFCAVVSLALAALLLTIVNGQAGDVVSKPVKKKSEASKPLSAVVTPAAIEDARVSTTMSSDKANEASTSLIEIALGRKVSVDFKQQPFGKIIVELAKSQEINIVLNPQIFQSFMELNAPVTFKADAITLRSVLHRLLYSVDCRYEVRSDRLEIVPHDRPRKELTHRCYPVHDLIEMQDVFGNPDAGVATLQELLEINIDSTTWNEVGGDGVMHSFGNTLVVAQTDDVQRAIENTLRVFRSIRDLKGDKLPVSMSIDIDDAMEQLRKNLREHRVTWQFDKVPLEEVISTVGKQEHCNISVVAEAISSMDIDLTQRISLDVVNAPFSKALQLLLEPLELDYYLQDEFIVISSTDHCAAQLATRVYPVGYLLESTQFDEDYADLIETVSKVIQPLSWDEAGGAGSIHAYPPIRVLAVSQSRAVHEQVEELLESLRAAQPAKPAVPQPTAMVTKIYDLSGRTGTPAAQPTAVPVHPVPATNPAAPAAGAAGAVPGVVAPPLAGGGAAEPNAVCAVPPSAPAGAALPIDAFGKLVQEKLSPKTWGGQGGKLYVIGNKLIVTQSADVHRRIPRLIDAVFGPDLSQHGKKSGGGGGGFFTVPAAIGSP